MILSSVKVSIGYEEKIIVKELDLEFDASNITSIIGPNGCGKTTLLRALTKMIAHTEGNIYLDDINIDDINNKEMSKMVAMLNQIHTCPMDFSVKNLVGYGRFPYQKWYESNSEEDDKIIEWAMEEANMIDFKDRKINNLSGGERQRAWIATALAQKPRILFLDEPTTYLDIAHQNEIMKLVKRLNQSHNIGVVMVLHDIEHALLVSDKVLVMKDGVKYDYGTPDEVITKEMLRDVYDVEADIVYLEGRKKPVILYEEI
ncbi:MAG: ABC transporter ATP-binding protein [Tissierellia bacterium]|nr:ABC transporter ATP-binding protein [Tissierellia bacterium]